MALVESERHPYTMSIKAALEKLEWQRQAYQSSVYEPARLGHLDLDVPAALVDTRQTHRLSLP